jgi:predicted amidohydrolase
MFNTREELYKVAEMVPKGETSKKWIELAKKRKVYICAGIAELGEDGIKCYNSSILIGPNGFIGKYRKQHLWNREKLFFEPGNTGFSVFDTPIGKISMLICFDMWFPEVFRILAMKGADLICIPTNWVDTPPQELTTMGTHLAIVNANINSLFIIAADRIGIERGCKFPGRSIIVGPSGWPNTPMASDDKEEIIYDEINISDSRRLNWNEFNVLLRDRRTDLYDIVLGSGEEIKPR